MQGKEEARDKARMRIRMGGMKEDTRETGWMKGKREMYEVR